MKTYGTLKIVEDAGGGVDRSVRGTPKRWFEFACVPQVNMRLKAVFSRIDKGRLGRLRMVVTPETCMEVEWFLGRYPMEMSKEARREMERGAEAHEETLRELELVISNQETVIGGKKRASIARTLAKPLRRYQEQAVEVLARVEGLLLGDALGLGKTVSAMGAMAAGGLPALVVCPTHLPAQWVAFLEVFLPGLKAHVIKGTRPYELPTEAEVLIISYSKLVGWGEVLRAREFPLVVFDEIQDLRHADTAKYRAARGIREFSGWALGLSATPIFNYGGEIYNILEITSPGKLGAREEFYREWCTDMGNGRYKINDPVTFGEYARDQFLMLRRRREEVGLELPKVERQVVTVPHDPEVLKKLVGSATELARLVLEGAFTERGQAARELDWKLRQATGVAKAPFVADFVRLLVESGEKVLLGGWHREVYEIWLERLKDLEPVMYTGTESPLQKSITQQQFVWGSAKVMIMSLRSGSGVDGLQKVCSTAVLGELDWSPAVHEQFIGRLNRDGVTGGVITYFCVSEAGSDPVVASVLGLKQSQAVGIVDPDRATSGEPEMLKQQETGRVTQLAADWLRRQGVVVEAAGQDGGEGEGIDS